MASSTLRADQLFGVAGIVAVITGGGSGLGEMMATTLAENGAAKVFIVGRRREKLDQVAAAYPSIIRPIVGDVTSQQSLVEVAATVRQEAGYINLLVANAGMAGPGLRGLNARATVADFVQSAWSTPMAELDAVYNLNCTAAYYTILAFLELLDAGNQRRKPGEAHSQVLATASMVAYMRDPRYGFAYCSSKAALVSMIKTFASFGISWGIRFNALALGLFPSDMSTAALNPFRIDKAKAVTDDGAFARSFLPAERAGSREDVAGALLYLSSRAGAYVNGSIVLVDGGKLATVPATY